MEMEKTTPSAAEQKREILFRGKRLHNGEWAFGDLRQWSDVDGHYASIYDAIEPYGTKDWRGVDPATVGQFTGETLNDQQLFEGDVLEIVRDYGKNETPQIERAVIDFKSGAFSVGFNFGDYDLTAIGWALEEWSNMCASVRLAGTIHDAKEQSNG